MTLQEIFYLVAIIFMSLTMIIMIVLAVAGFNLIERLKEVVKTVGDFSENVSEKSGKILDEAERAIPKIIEVLSIGTIVKKAIKSWEDKKK